MHHSWTVDHFERSATWVAQIIENGEEQTLATSIVNRGDFNILQLMCRLGLVHGMQQALDADTDEIEALVERFLVWTFSSNRDEVYKRYAVEMSSYDKVLYRKMLLISAEGWPRVLKLFSLYLNDPNFGDVLLQYDKLVYSNEDLWGLINLGKKVNFVVEQTLNQKKAEKTKRSPISLSTLMYNRSGARSDRLPER